MVDLGSMAQSVGALLKEREQTVAVSESSAGGLISAALLAVPGASAYFLGGGVVYTHASRGALLSIPKDAFEGLQPGAEEFGLRLARVARDHLGAVWGVGESGAAGPAGSRYGYDAGHAVVAVAGPVEDALILETGHADRVKNMWAFAAAALGLLEASIKKGG